MFVKLNIEAFTLFIKCKMNFLKKIFIVRNLLLINNRKRFDNIAFVAYAFAYV